MFRGINGIKVDVKGRMAIPSRYRERLKRKSHNTLVITIETEARCLLLYPLPAWEAIEEKIAALPGFNPAVRRLQRLLIGHATEVELDKQGRILVPTMLRKYAGLKKRAIIVGQGKKFELWDETHWHQCCEQWLTEAENLNAQSMPDEVKSIAL